MQLIGKTTKELEEGLEMGPYKEKQSRSGRYFRRNL